MSLVLIARLAVAQPGAAPPFSIVQGAEGMYLSPHVLLSDLGVSDTSMAGSSTSAAPAINASQIRGSILVSAFVGSLVAYGVFSLRFNRARARSADAADAYGADVVANADRYLSQGLRLDQIESYLTWEDKYDDAVTAREWSARAGLLTVVAGFIAIVDAASTGNGRRAASVGRLSLSPDVDFRRAVSRPSLSIRARIEM